MKALVTGATSGIGLEMAKVLHNMGYELILVSRTKSALEETKSLLGDGVEIFPADLSSATDCKALFSFAKDKGVSVLVNNAGFGVYGTFLETDLEEELNMLDLNCKGLHILTKLFLQEFQEKDAGYILNVASSAGFLSGPLMASYYATKNYVVALTEGIYQELKEAKSNVHISMLCTGPIETGFNKRAGVATSMKGISAKEVAESAIKAMFQKKLWIIPEPTLAISSVLQRLVPKRVLLSLVYQIQYKKNPF
ncbi:SDR family oxidoreductase [Chakrabartyella piscis]|uniref:SDR family NAD(P)-dependent oxidoreductase n=1 Tax=Chakrabartyella piscis TaxID=2918914 RepID=UPI0029588FE3|nr:SDR family oxidoreductase [Chakrabartyella piscis]